MFDLDAYQKWLKTEAACVDCGRLAGERDPGEVWVTETQCMECWRENGIPEQRGLPSARDSYDRARDGAGIASVRPYISFSSSVYRT